MQYKYLFLIVFVFVVLSCKKKKTITYHDNGNKYESYEVNDKDEKSGLYEAYDELGKLREKAQYTHNIYSGTRTLYFPNGSIEIEEPYENNGQLNGMYKKYFENGTIHIEKPYKENAINGMLKVYYPSGKIKEEVTMVDNNENGPFVEYFENGKIQWKGTYLNGDKEFGLLEEFDEGGQLIKRMKCDTLGICRTFWRPTMPEINYDTLSSDGLVFLNSQITNK